MATSIFVADEHLKLFKSGHPTPTFRGNRISTEEIDYTGLHAVFPRITEDEGENSNRDFFCLYLFNDSLLPAKGIVVMSSNTRSSYTHMRWGVDPAGIGDGINSGVAQEIVNKNTTPANVQFKDNTTRSSNNPLVLPTIPPKKCIAIWFERSTVFNAKSEEDDNITMIFDTSNIIGDTGIVDEPGTNDDVISGDTDIDIDLDWLNKFISSLLNINNFFFLGNATNADDPTSWINNVAKFRINTSNPNANKQFLKDIIKFVFGETDVTSNTKRNQIINGVDFKAKSGYQLIIKRNIAYIILDTSGYQLYSNPSAHYNKIVQYLKIANQHPEVDFKVVLSSKSMYGQLPDNDNDENGNSKVRLDTVLRNTYHQLFIDQRVHLVISAGIHNYQRCHVLGYNAASSEDPSTFFTGDAPHYNYAQDVKDFGNTGCLFINVTSGIKKPLHNVPTANQKAYVAKTVIPTEGPSFLHLYSRQRDQDRAPILEGRYYTYKKNIPQIIASQNLSQYAILKDQFSIKYYQEPIDAPPGED